MTSIMAQAFDEEKCQLTQSKLCVDYGKRLVEGLYTNDECWKYETKSRCISKELNSCSTLENNRGCDETSAKCITTSDFGLCSNLEKTFSCGRSELDKGIKHIETEFHTIRDEKDLSQCHANEINKYCELLDEQCIEPNKTRNINGKAVYKACWKWDKKYRCRSDTFIDECKHIPESCKIVREPICLHLNKNDKTCDHKELKYQCSETKTFQKECKSQEFCLGGICEKTTRHQHNDFGSAISKLSVLAQMKSDGVDGCKCPSGKSTCAAGEIDPASCKFFSGESKQCHKSTAQQNCCSEKGFIRDIFHCTQEEQDLFKQRQTGFCYPVGSWDGEDLNDQITFTSYQSYCCFKGKLAKIIQEQGRKQLEIGWGNDKSPDCRSLSLDEIRRIDFSKIDFSELYADIAEKMKKPINGDISAKIKNFYKEKQ